MVWVVDGVRRQRDKTTFYRILEEYSIKSDVPSFIRIIGPNDCRLIKEWHNSEALVFLDFQDMDNKNQPIIWFLFPRTTNNEAYLWPITKVGFIELHNCNKFDEAVEKIIKLFIAKLINDEKKVEMEKFKPEFERRKRLS